MKLYQLALVLPVVLLSVCLTTGCGSKETKVIEAVPMTEEEEATYEIETTGGAAASDESQN